MDASIGVVMQKLRELGLENNTLVIFTRYQLIPVTRYRIIMSVGECARGRSVTARARVRLDYKGTSACAKGLANSF